MLHTAKAKKPITRRARSGCPTGRVAIVRIVPTVAVVAPPRLIPASVTSTPTTRERAPRVTSPARATRPPPGPVATRRAERSASVFAATTAAKRSVLQHSMGRKEQEDRKPATGSNAARATLYVTWEVCAPRTVLWPGVRGRGAIRGQACDPCQRVFGDVLQPATTLRGGLPRALPSSG